MCESDSLLLLFCADEHLMFVFNLLLFIMRSFDFRIMNELPENMRGSDLKKLLNESSNPHLPNLINIAKRYYYVPIVSTLVTNFMSTMCYL